MTGLNPRQSDSFLRQRGSENAPLTEASGRTKPVKELALVMHTEVQGCPAHLLSSKLKQMQFSIRNTIHRLRVEEKSAN